MPPRVTYWTGIYEPSREALSKEVLALRSALSPGGTVVSFSAGQRSSLVPRDGVFRLSGRRWLALRLLASLVEPRGDLTHAFGALDAWHFLRSLGRRPIVFTAALPGPALERALYEKVAAFAAETEPLVEALVLAGAPRERVRLVYPGVDLARFSPAPTPARSPFRLLFASGPADARELGPRGVTLLVEAARLAPWAEVVLLFRSWGSGEEAARALERLRPPSNVRVERRDATDMAEVYRSAHAVACPFAPGFGKSCPNSVVEALACGRPAILASEVGIAGLIERRGAGIAVERSAPALVRGLERLREDLGRLASNARALAEEEFGLPRFVEAYADLYERALSRSSS